MLFKISFTFSNKSMDIVNFLINYYDVPVIWTTLEVHYDLQSGRYLAVGLNNEEDFTVDFSTEVSESDFTISALRRAGRR